MNCRQIRALEILESGGWKGPYEKDEAVPFEELFDSHRVPNFSRYVDGMGKLYYKLTRND